VQPWRQLSPRAFPRKLAWAGGAAAGVVLCVAAAFGFQQWQISVLQNKWDAMAPKVNELNTDQDQIKNSALVRQVVSKHPVKLWSAFPMTVRFRPRQSSCAISPQ